MARIAHMDVYIFVLCNIARSWI